MTRRLVVAVALACALATPAIARHHGSNDTTVTCNRFGCSDQINSAGRSAVKVAQRKRIDSNGASTRKSEPVVFFGGASSAAEIAKRYIGHKPSVTELKGWARETGIGAWRWGVRVYCALGVNKVLADAGIRGSGSALAASFRAWGERTNNPRPGDIAIPHRNHVAVVVGRSGDTVTVVSFNDSGHQILRREYPLRGVIYRTNRPRSTHHLAAAESPGG